MNIKNKKMIGNIYFFSFFKRAFICFLCIILCFNVVCKPKKTYAATLGVAVTWGLVEYLAALVASAGIALTVDGFCRGLGLYGGDEEVTEEEALQWCKNNISIDGDNNVVFTDDAKAFINDYLLGTYNDSVTMVYRYPLNKANIDASNFPNKVVFDAFVDLLDAFPDCYFYFNSSDCQNPNFIIDGARNNFGSAYRVQVVKPFSGVNAYPDLVTTPVTFYGEDWVLSPMSLFWIVSSDEFKTADNISYFELTSYDNYNNMNYGNYYSNLNDLKSAGFSFSSGSCASLSMCNKFSWSRTFTDFNTPYSASDVPINVYKTVADMKKDIGSQIVGSYTPDYTGTPNYNITTSEVNNIVNNYYPDDDPGGGSGSGSDDSGGSSSGGSGIIDGLGKLFGAIGNIIDKLFGFVLGLLSKVVDFFGSILEMFTDTLTKLIDVIPSGFNEFLAAMFPYIPEEWITIAEFILLVSAIGCVVALFKR